MKQHFRSFLLLLSCAFYIVTPSVANVYIPLKKKTTDLVRGENRVFVASDNVTNHSLDKRATGSYSLSPIPGIMYEWQGSIAVGGNPTTFNVLIDTGSGDIILPGSACTTGCASHTTYTPTAASNLHLPTFSISYTGGGAVTGDVYADKVVAGSFTASSQAVVAATSYNAQLSKANFPPDGILGLSMASKSGQPTFLQSLVKENVITEPVFVSVLTASNPHLYLGGDDPNVAHGPLTTVNAIAVTGGSWSVPMNVLLNGVQSASGTTGRLDTGANLIFGPPAAVKTLYGLVGAKPDISSPGAYILPCPAKGSPQPMLTFQFSGQSFSIPLVLAPYPNDPSSCLGVVWNNPLASAGDYWILGTPFLQTVYTRFDLGKNSVGFATIP